MEMHLDIVIELKYYKLMEIKERLHECKFFIFTYIQMR